MTRTDLQPAVLGLPDPVRPAASRTAALAVLSSMQLMIILDGTIVSVALPTIQHSLGFSASGLAWVVNGYLIAFAGLLLLFGRMGDVFGAARVFESGVIVFTLASLICGLARTPAQLVVGRGLQGAGGAMAAAVILGMIVRLFPDRSEQTRAIAVYSCVSAAGATIGLLCGGILTETLGWQADFIVNVPLGIVATCAAFRLFAVERPVGDRRRADYPGGALATAGLSLGVLTILRAADAGWGSRTTALTAVAALGSLAAFIARQASAAMPLVPLRLFRQRESTIGNVTSMFVFAAGFGFQYLTALYLQQVLGLDALQTGLAFLPVPILIGTLSLGVTPRLLGRWGSRPVLMGGLALVGAAFLLLSRLPVSGGYVSHVLPAMLLSGAGMALALPGVTVAAMSGSEPRDAGIASGLANTMQQSGAAIGLAVIASVAAARTATESATSRADALVDGYRLGYLVAAASVLAALVLASFLAGRER